MVRRFLLLVAALAALGGCSSMKPEDFANAEPKLILEEYFQGKSRAYGFVENFSGKVIRQFVVDIEGRWDGKTLTLIEDFVWNDGEVEQRIWELTKVDAHTWEGRTADAIGVATGKLYGNAFNLRYDFNLKTGNGRTKVSFDDWMFLQPDGVLLNRAQIRKFGLTVAEVTISFKREPEAVGQVGEVRKAAE